MEEIVIVGAARTAMPVLERQRRKRRGDKVSRILYLIPEKTKGVKSYWSFLCLMVE